MTSPVVIAHVLPELLNLYGDGGNVQILKQRLAWRGIPVEVKRLEKEDDLAFEEADLVFIGGAPDREQKLATEMILRSKKSLKSYIEADGPLLAICGGFQILGRTWLLNNEEVPGLGLLDYETRRPGTSSDRLTDNIVLQSPISTMPVVGFENHAGWTFLDEGVTPFGKVISKTGSGNNNESHDNRADGILSGNVLGTYLHGPLLSKNPEVADWLLAQAVTRHNRRTGENIELPLEPLDDAMEIAANDFMVQKLI